MGTRQKGMRLLASYIQDYRITVLSYLNLRTNLVIIILNIKTTCMD